MPPPSYPQTFFQVAVKEPKSSTPPSQRPLSSLKRGCFFRTAFSGPYSNDFFSGSSFQFRKPFSRGSPFRDPFKEPLFNRDPFSTWTPIQQGPIFSRDLFSRDSFSARTPSRTPFQQGPLYNRDPLFQRIMQKLKRSIFSWLWTFSNN